MPPRKFGNSERTYFSIVVSALRVDQYAFGYLPFGFQMQIFICNLLKKLVQSFYFLFHLLVFRSQVRVLCLENFQFLSGDTALNRNFDLLQLDLEVLHIIALLLQSLLKTLVLQFHLLGFFLMIASQVETNFDGMIVF